MVKMTAKIPKGARDAQPTQMAVREQAFDTIKRIFQQHGAVGIDTPVFELKETLTGKYGEDSKLIYDLADQGGELLSLRYDLTVPFARYCATHGVVQLKRYHIAKVYRRDNPAMKSGRFREFYQCDFDIAGDYKSMPMLADSDVLKVVCDVLSALDIGNFKVKLNHRKLLDAIMEVCGVPADKFRPICSAIDKLDKESWQTVKHEMTEIKKLDVDSADQLEKYVVKRSGYGPTLLAELQADSKLNGNASAQQAFTELTLLFEYLKAYGVLDKISFDLSLARGLDYYTGLIYEAVLTDTDRFGSIAAGGRYDGLVGMFGSKQIPAVGVSVGIERILTLLEEKAEASGQMKKSYIQVLVASVGKEMILHKMSLCAELWRAGIAAEFLYNKDPNPKKQVEYALEHGIPIMLMIGENELKDGVVGLKVFKQQTQVSVPRDQVVEQVKQALTAAASDNSQQTNNSTAPTSGMAELEQKIDSAIIR